MASLDPWIKSLPFFMPSGHFTVDQMYGFKINDHQLFFLQAYGVKVTQSCLTLCNPVDMQSMGFSRPDY